MKIEKVAKLLDANVLTGEALLDRKVTHAFGSDLMSDVLAFVEGGTLLLTGLTNHQVIRTAEMIDIFAIIFVRGKVPTDEVVALARERDIILLSTDQTLFNACGLLYQAGLRGEIENG